MKKSILVMGLAIVATTMFSCKKEYTCECQKIYTDSDGSTRTVNDGSYIFKDNEARADDKCNDLETTGNDVIGGDYSRECHI